jgi:hypothetical protein
MSGRETSGKTRWANVAIYLAVCVGLLILAGVLGSGNAARPVAVVVAGVMFVFALFTAWRK